MILTCFLLGSLVFGVPGVKAYEFLGYEWSYSDIRDLTYKVDSNCDHYAYIVDTSYYASSSWNNIVSSGCPNLNEVTSGDLVYITDYEDPYGDLAYTYVWHSGGYYYSSIIYINDYKIDVTYYTDNLHFQFVVCHEMGHTLGLAHESGSVVMYPYDSVYLDLGIYQPTTDDENGIVALYS